jgi:toxin ParE1/3/4
MIPATILHEAETELWEAVEFYESKCVGLGLDFETEIKAAVELIQQSPDRGPIRDDGTRRYLVRRFPYFVVYIHHKNHVWVIAVAHCRRRPGYWSGRTRRGASSRGPRRG